jgi:phosphopantothenoylcysteine decarboxylase/phosphopantothenate--cysteine ligase
MSRAIKNVWSEIDVLVMVAAVADYRPERVSDSKLKKEVSGLEHLALERTEDILAWTSDAPGRSQRTVIGFAAETDELETHAQEKLSRKGLDWIVANRVGTLAGGFGPGSNAVTLIDASGQTQSFPSNAKRELAADLVNHWVPVLRDRHVG